MRKAVAANAFNRAIKPWKQMMPTTTLRFATNTQGVIYRVWGPSGRHMLVSLHMKNGRFAHGDNQWIFTHTLTAWP